MKMLFLWTKLQEILLQGLKSRSSSSSKGKKEEGAATGMKGNVAAGLSVNICAVSSTPTRNLQLAHLWGRELTGRGQGGREANFLSVLVSAYQTSEMISILPSQ